VSLKEFRAVVARFSFDRSSTASTQLAHESRWLLSLKREIKLTQDQQNSVPGLQQQHCSRDGSVAGPAGRLRNAYATEVRRARNCVPRTYSRSIAVTGSKSRPAGEIHMREIIGVYGTPHAHWVGDGFPVRSLFSHNTHGDLVSPFLLLDYAGPRMFEPAKEPRGVGQHPHRGFETVTIVYEGEVEHRDSTGAGGLFGPGDVQWMTAASGILHEEMHSRAFTAKGGMFEMVQLWVNLPAKDKSVVPGYQTLVSNDIASVDLPDGAGTVRVIAGNYDGHKGPAHTFTPIDIWDVRLKANHGAPFTLPEGHMLAVVVLVGTVEINGAAIAREAQFVLLASTGGDITIEANSDAKLLILSGAPINEPVVAHGPFVMNTIDEIKQAMLDFQSGKFGALAG
jgi:quercetin 2,3-dioxygenase